MVAVTGDELWITPTFPFNMIAPHGFMGLEYRTARSHAVIVKTEKTWLGSVVVLQLPAPNGDIRTIELKLKSPDAFLNALQLAG